MINKELYKRLKKPAVHAEEACPPASVTILEAFPEPNKTPRDPVPVVVEQPKWQNKEPIDGKKTLMSNREEVPQKRSERHISDRNNGRFYHKPWPFKRNKPKEAVEQRITTSNVPNL